MNTEQVDAILTACCGDPDESRFGQPFRGPDGRVYATDGRILVRSHVPTTVGVMDGPPKDIDVSTLPWAALSSPEVDWTDAVPPLPTLEQVECRSCYGRGERRCDMDHYHECDRCGGTGRTGPEVDLPPVRVGDRWVSSAHAALLSGLGVRLRPVEGRRLLAFVGDGFDGFVVDVNEHGRTSDVGFVGRVRTVLAAVQQPDPAR